MNSFHTILILILILLTISCEEEIDWDLHSNGNSEVVVEALITNEDINQEIRLSQSFKELNDKANPIEGAQIFLFSETDTVIFEMDPDEPGLYKTNLPYRAKNGVPYLLLISHNGMQNHAVSYMAPVLPLPEVRFRTVGSGDSVEIEEIAPLYDPFEQAMYEVDIDWRHLFPGESSRAKMFFYTFNTIDGAELVRPTRERVIIPKGSFVILKKYGLNEQFADYLRALVMETEWNGGVYDEDSSSPPTNLNGDAQGFFAVCAVRTDTIVAQ